MVVKMAREGFLEFCCAVDPTYTPSWFHEVLTSKLQKAYERMKRGEKVRIILECPPRHGKTKAATVLFPAWILGKDNLPIITCSYSADLAEKFGQDTRDVLNDSVYKKIFKARLRQDMTAKGNWATLQGGSYLATGVGGGITGKGFKIGIVDDPFKNREEADSETVRESVWRWWNSTFFTRQEGISAIIVIATRWHMDDLIGRLLDEQEFNERAHRRYFDKWEVIRFPAIAEEDEKYRRKGDALWPAKFPLSELEVIRGKDVYEWSALYQQNPILQANAEFKLEWFKYYEPEDIKELRLIYYTLVDLAISQKTTADNTVIRTVGKDRLTGKIYLIEETAGRMDPLETIEAITDHVKRFSSRVWIESVGYQASLQYFLQEDQRRRSQKSGKFEFFDVNELSRKNTSSKEARIRGLIPLYKAGMIYHRRSDGELERELLQFPKGKHDDRIDCLSFILDVADITLLAQQEEEIEDFDPTKAFTPI